MFLLFKTMPKKGIYLSLAINAVSVITKTDTFHPLFCIIYYSTSTDNIPLKK